MTPDRSIAAIAAGQHGLFTPRQALDAGHSRKAIEVRLTSGRWLEPHRGVYAIAGTPNNWKQDVLAATLAYGPRCAASHTSAATLLGIADVRTSPIHVTMPTGQHRERRVGVIVHEARLLPRDIATIDKIRITRAERTLVDLAGVVSPRALEAALDTAVTTGLTTVRVVVRYIRERRLTHNRGMGVLRALLEERAIGVTATEFERLFRRRLKKAKLPLPIPQFQIGKRRVDFAYPDARIAIELDSIKWHSSAQRFQSDRERYNDLVLAGWLPLLFTWHDVNGAWPRTERTLRTALASVGSPLSTGRTHGSNARSR